MVPSRTKVADSAGKSVPPSVSGCALCRVKQGTARGAREVVVVRATGKSTLKKVSLSATDTVPALPTFNINVQNEEPGDHQVA